MIPVSATICTYAFTFDAVPIRRQQELLELQEAVRVACDEIVPAALNCNQKILYPGCCDFSAQMVPTYSTHNQVTITITADYCDERAADIGARADDICKALCELLPDTSFTVYINLSHMGKSANPRFYIPDEVVDMDMSSAIDRARQKIAKIDVNES